MTEIKLLFEDKEMTLDDNINLFGYDIIPTINSNAHSDPNTLYKFKRWSRREECQPVYNCEISGEHFASFVKTNVDCNGKRVFFMPRRPPYVEPTCLREIPTNSKNFENEK
jgi:hypothetical protein